MPDSVEAIPKPTAIQRIPDRFTYDGFNHRLVLRDGRRAVFLKSQPRYTTTWFEVVRLGYREAENIDGKNYPARETYPKSEEWGVNAWTCFTLDTARRKMAEIENL